MPELHGMLDMGRGELDELFAAADAPEVDGLAGYMRGLHYSGAGPLDTRLWKKLSNRSPWRGMTVDGDVGVNHLGYPPFTFDAVEFDVSTVTLDDGEAVQFDYGEHNPPPVSGIREHVRRVDEDSYLAAASLRVGGELRFMYYFGLEDAGEIEVE